MSKKESLADHQDLIAICMACDREECAGECIEYRNKYRELMGLPPLAAYGHEPKKAAHTKRGRKKGTNGSRIKITAFGKTMTMKEWAEESGIPYKTLYARFKKGMQPEEALSREVRGGPRHLLTYKGESHTIKEWARLLGCARSTLNTEINKIEREGACCDGGNH